MIEPDYPSVTQILSLWSDFSRVSHAVMERAKNRGTRVHAIAAAHLLGLYVPPIDPDIQGYVDSFRRWADLMVDKVIAVEPCWVSHELRVKGHPDALLVLRGDFYPSVPDWKTPLAKMRTWAVQLGTYKGLGMEEGHKIDRFYSVRLSPDGKMPRLDEYTSQFEALWQTFKNCVQAYRFFKEGYSGT